MLIQTVSTKHPNCKPRLLTGLRGNKANNKFLGDHNQDRRLDEPQLIQIWKLLNCKTPFLFWSVYSFHFYRSNL